MALAIQSEDKILFNEVLINVCDVNLRRELKIHNRSLVGNFFFFIELKGEANHLLAFLVFREFCDPAVNSDLLVLDWKPNKRVTLSLLQLHQIQHFFICNLS